MGVDIKSLRIGSHIAINGKRHRISNIDALNGQIGIEAYTTDKDGVKHPFGYPIEQIEPIAITPELLKELGFEYHEYDNGNLWEWRISDLYKAYGYLEFDEDTTTIWRGRLWHMKESETEFRVEYLHELENLFYMFYEKELIPD